MRKARLADIPVHDVLAVQVVQCHDDLTGEEDGGGVVEAMGCSEVREQLPPSHVLQQHVQKPVVMVGPGPGVGETLAIMSSLSPTGREAELVGNGSSDRLPGNLRNADVYQMASYVNAISQWLYSH